MHARRCVNFPLASSELLCSDASCVFLQGEAERAPTGEAEVGGEDYGSVQSPRPQHAIPSQQGQVHYINLFTCTIHQAANVFVNYTRALYNTGVSLIDFM